jgi:hypothetical protein
MSVDDTKIQKANANKEVEHDEQYRVTITIWWMRIQKE